MGRMIDSYNAYLADWNAKHPNIVQPICTNKYSHNKPDVSSMTIISHSPKYWSDWGVVYQADDGRIVEASETNGMHLPIYATFASKAEYDAWCAPKGFKELFEQW